MKTETRSADDRWPSGAYRNVFLNRTRLLLGERDMAELARKTVAVAGCGGVGGATAVTLVRMGVGRLIIADPGAFDPPDTNRQWAASRNTMGRNKAVVYEELLTDINPSLGICTFPEGVTEDNLRQIVDDADLVVDGLDLHVPLPLRFEMYRRTRLRGLYCVSSPIIGFGTLTMVGAPDGMALEHPVREIVERAKSLSRLPEGFGDHFFRQHVHAIEASIGSRGVPSSAIATGFSAAASCAEIMLILLADRHPEWPPPTCLPEVTVVEPMGKSYRRVRYEKLFSGGGETSADVK
jgi:tRNA threonylcarbamoyladenosine dehydratase